jgi:hypothetical protein
MHVLRHLFLRQRWLAALVVAAALAMKALIPAGYMVGSQSGRVLTIQICADRWGRRSAARSSCRWPRTFPVATRRMARPRRKAPAPFPRWAMRRWAGPIRCCWRWRCCLFWRWALPRWCLPRRAGRPFAPSPLRGPPALG